MKLKLLSTTMKDFKGNTDKTIQYSSKNTTEIKGRNEQGKTTIADSFYDTFVKCDYLLNSNPNIRPKGKEDSIPTVTHVCDIDGKEVIVSKIQKISRSKTDSNKITLTNSYEVNSVPKNETTFNAYLEEMGMEFKKFLALSHPNSFLSQKQIDMRELIFQLADGKSDADIAQMNKDTTDVAKLLENYKLEEIEAMNKATIKKINDTHGAKGELTEKAIVAKQELLVDIDVAEIELQKNVLKEQIAEIERKISDGSASGKEVSELGQKQMQLEFDKNEICRQANETIVKERRELDSKKTDALNEFEKYRKKIANTETLMVEKKEAISDVEKKRASLGALWNTYNESVFDESKWIFDENSTVCSLCGQDLPVEKTESLKADFDSKKEDALKKFKADKAAQMEIIEKNGFLQKELIESLQKEITELGAKLPVLKEDEIKYMKLQNDCAEKLKILPGTADMSQNTEYQKKLTEIKVIQDKLDSMQDGDSYIDDLQSQKAELQTELDRANEQIAKFSGNERIEEQIEALKAKRLDYEQAKADAEKLLYQAKEVSTRKDNLLSDEINSHFMFVKWKLWDYQKNGEKKSICVPYLLEDGIEKTFADSMSGGTKIRAKIDICFSLQKFFHMYLPIFVDEASEIDRDKVPNVDTQVILLSRADCDLTVC